VAEEVRAACEPELSIPPLQNEQASLAHWHFPCFPFSTPRLPHIFELQGSIGQESVAPIESDKVPHDSEVYAHTCPADLASLTPEKVCSPLLIPRPSYLISFPHAGLCRAPPPDHPALRVQVVVWCDPLDGTREFTAGVCARPGYWADGDEINGRELGLRMLIGPSLHRAC
jgi:hypothetical protein